MSRVMQCRLCGRKYVVGAHEVRLDASVCRQCEVEAQDRPAPRQFGSGLHPSMTHWFDHSKGRYEAF